LVELSGPDAGNFRNEISQHARTRKANCPLNSYKEGISERLDLTLPV
jgi:hypothetical protein